MTLPARPHELLGVAESASADEIRHAFRRQAFLCHPDRNPGDPSAHETFLALREAYDALTESDPDAGVDADQVVEEMVRAAREAARRRAGTGDLGTGWQHERVELTRPTADRLRAHLQTPTARVGLAVAVAVGIGVALGLSTVATVSAATAGGLLLGGSVAALAVLRSDVEPWVAAVHWRGLQDSRWDVTILWSEIASVAEAPGGVRLQLRAEGVARLRSTVPAAAFAAPDAYWLPVCDPGRLAGLLAGQTGAA